jgi:hypothetical protein
MHLAPAYAGSGEWSNHFGSYVRSNFMHFCRRLFPGLEPITSWSQGNSFTAVLGLPFNTSNSTKLKFRTVIMLAFILFGSCDAHKIKNHKLIVNAR